MNRRASLHVSIRMSAVERHLLRYVASFQRKSLRQFLIESALQSAADIVAAHPHSAVPRATSVMEVAEFDRFTGQLWHMEVE
jgi:uncharacterized protein (DUF1778 family)